MMRRWLMLIVLTLLGGALHAAPLSIDPLAPQVNASTELRLLRDPQGQLGLAEVLARLDDFRPATRRELVTGFNPGVIWLQLSLATPAAQPLTRWLSVGSAKTQVVTAYQRQQADWQVQRSGRAVLPLERPIVTLAPVFPVLLVPGQTTELLLRVDSRGTTDLTSVLWQPESYHPVESREATKLAALLGGLLLGSALALTLFARLRETQYLWHALLLLAIAGLEASRSNFLGTYAWPADRHLPPATLALFAVLALFSLSKVAAHALELATRMPWAHRLLLALRWVAVGSALIVPFHYGHGVRLLSLTSTLQNIAVLLLCLLAWQRGLPNGRIFALAFSLALLTEIARQLANLGVLPWTAAMESSSLFFLLASPLILLGLIEQTRRLSERLHLAEQLQEAKSSFLARISHELRSPLNTILGYSRMLARGSGKLGLAEGTAGIENSALRLLRLIDELLDEARTAAGKLSVSPAPLALRPWLDDIEQAARLACEAQENRFRCEVSGELPALVCLDGQRLRQVLENLLANANRHTRQGTLRLILRSRIEADSAVLDFAVEDDGEGIAPGRLATIFEPFERGDTRQNPGHGLGLAICRELIQRMGSDIAATSSPDRGSRFAFSLRCLILPAAATPLPVTTATSASPPVGRPRVLLAEDDLMQLELLAETLEEDGFEVTPTSGGQAAIEALGRTDQDLVITDQMMPLVDGWDVLRHARQLHAGLPVILISAARPCRPAGLAPEIDFDASLLKPARSEEILATAWRLILKVGAGDTALDWAALARLASEGEVSGIEDWIAAARTTAPQEAAALDWIERQSHGLHLALLERFARQAGQAVLPPPTCPPATC